MREDLRVVVPTGGAGRLDTVLTELLAEVVARGERVTRSQLKKRIAQGAVSINGVTASKAGTVVEEGDEILLEELQERENPFEPYHAEIPVLFEDEWIAVIDKPPRMTVHPGAGTENDTLLNALIAKEIINPAIFTESIRPGIVHRLDKETSGVLVVARTPAALSQLAVQFQERKTNKEYLALAVRKPRGGLVFDQEDTGVISAALGRDARDRTRMAVTERGKPSRTEWTVIERLKHAFFLRLKIITGRTHQIRVHLESAGSGVIGDKSYGHFETLPKEGMRIIEALGRQALHAHKLEFLHPGTGEQLCFESPLPQDIEECLDSFRLLS